MLVTEFNSFLEHLREKYSKASEKYGPHLFNLKSLEDRVLYQRKSKVGFKVFVRDEIEFFEKMRKLAVQKYESKIKTLESSKHLNDMIERNEAKIRKYPDLFFNPHASLEMRHFFGAITEFYKQYYSLLASIFRDSINNKIFTKIFTDIERFYIHNESNLSVMAIQYIEDLKSIQADISEKKWEQTDRKYLQTGGKYLYQCYLFLKEQKDKKEYTNNIIIKNSLLYTESILVDFRLLNLVMWEKK